MHVLIAFFSPLGGSIHSLFYHLTLVDYVVDSCRSSSEKYSPVDWSVYFDKEEDVTFPDSNDVSLQILSFSTVTILHPFR